MLCRKDKQSVLLLHARTLRLSRVSCEQLVSRGVDFANHLGYRPDGIVKGSQAARGMSAEAKLYSGYLPPVRDGGICASLQSIGAIGFIKEQPRENIRLLLKNVGLLYGNEYAIENGDSEHLIVIELPSYFTLSIYDEPALVDDYRSGGYNHVMAENMLNESILPFCRESDTPCSMEESSGFEVLKFERLENIESFEKHLCHEARVARNIHQQHARTKSPDLPIPSWLKKLSLKNGLNPVANTVYLLHGTNRENLGDIVREGLKTRFSLERGDTLRYGKGLYFADKACKASSYARNDGILLVCRVVLGRTEILRRDCPSKLFPSFGYDSCHAKASVTKGPGGFPQLHNEYIIYDECACYPEFVINFLKC